MDPTTGIAQLGVSSVIVVILLAIIRVLLVRLDRRDELIERMRQESRSDQAVALPALREATIVMARVAEREADRAAEDRVIQRERARE